MADERQWHGCGGQTCVLVVGAWKVESPNAMGISTNEVRKGMSTQQRVDCEGNPHTTSASKQGACSGEELSGLTSWEYCIRSIGS